MLHNPQPPKINQPVNEVFYTDSRQLICSEDDIDRKAGGKNIFDKGIRDYHWLNDIKKIRKNKQQYFREINKLLFCDSIPKVFARQMSQSPITPALKHEYSNIFSPVRRPQTMFSDVNPFSQGLQFFVSNVEAVMAEVREVFYSKIRFPEWLPITTNIPRGATEYMYKIVDRQGSAAFVDNSSTNSPLVGISAQNLSIPLRPIGNRSKLSLYDIEIATRNGLSLTLENTTTAITAIAQKMEDIILGVDLETAYLQAGILNNSLIPIQTEPTPWNNLGNSDDVVARLLNAVAQIEQNTNDIFGQIIDTRLALYVSQEVAAFLMSPRAAVRESIWEAFTRQNTWPSPIDMIKVQEFGTASTTGAVIGSNRALFGFPSSKEVWEFPLPEEPMLASTQNLGTTIMNEYWARCGVKISMLRPGGMLYFDNIFTNDVNNFVGDQVNKVLYHPENLIPQAEKSHKNLKVKKKALYDKAKKQNEEQ